MPTWVKVAIDAWTSALGVADRHVFRPVSRVHFTVSLGVADAPSHQQPVQDVSLAGIPVLIVDDNDTNRRILVETLRKWRMQPEATASAGEALDLLAGAIKRGKPFSLILTDVHMPQMDGFAFVEQVKKHPEFATATVMMLTSGGQRGGAARCRALGVSAYLTKPVRAAELHAAVTSLVAERSPGHPKNNSDAPLITQQSLREGRAATASLRILLAEDNVVNQHLALRILEKQGHRVILAENGRKAVSVLEEQQVDVVLMDVQMPEMGGLEATALIREQEKGTGRHVPIIALTAHAMQNDKRCCLQMAQLEQRAGVPLTSPQLNEVVVNIHKIFSYGHRNGFGLAFDPMTGFLWESENGDDAFDEMNRITAGSNGGWIQIMGPLSRLADYKQIEASFTPVQGNLPVAGNLPFSAIDPTTFIPALQQVRWPPTLIADWPGQARDRLFVLPGSHYKEPEFSWKWALAPAAIGFADSGLGSQHVGNLFVGASRTFLDEGYLFEFRFDPSRRHFAFSDAKLKDRVDDNDYKFDEGQSGSLLAGKNFGIVTNIVSGPDGNLYVTSLSNGAVYMIR